LIKPDIEDYEVLGFLKSLVIIIFVAFFALSGCSNPDPQTAGSRALAEAICTFDKNYKKETQGFKKCVTEFSN
tara:strand:- start:365 stop:583 length:219 start_codon:yes stop_codon:yes gene_type:complete